MECDSIIASQRTPLFWLTAGLVIYALFLFAPQVLNDGDTYWHIAAGNWMLSHHSVLMVDPFSATFGGQPWVAHEWLSEILMAAAFRLGGWTGLVVLFGAAGGLAIGLLARDVARSLPPVVALLAVVIGVDCILPGLLARPHVLALPVLELWTAGLLRARARGGVPWACLPLMAVWVNLHGGFLFGLVLVVPFALEAALAEGWKAGLRWSGFLLAAVAMSLVNPHGLAGLLFPIDLINLPALQNVGEWRSPDFQTVQPLELAILAALFAGFSRGLRLPLLRLLVLLGLLHMALQHTRHQMLVGVCGTLIFAASLGRGVAVPRARWAWVLASAAVVALTGLRVTTPLTRGDDAVSPMAALAHVPPAVASLPVLNEYGFGGYLIFRGRRPYIDSRAELYGEAFLEHYAAMMRPDRAVLAATLAKDHIGWTLLAAGSPAAEAMDTLPGWHRLYADDIAVVHDHAPPDAPITN